MLDLVESTNCRLTGQALEPPLQPRRPASTSPIQPNPARHALPGLGNLLGLARTSPKPLNRLLRIPSKFR